MTIVVPFVPPSNAPFTFIAQLDSQPYQVAISWNAYGQRWYVNITLLTGDLVLCIAMIESPDDADISITQGYFDTTLIYRASSQQFEVSE